MLTSDGIVSGVPTVAGTATPTVHVQDALGANATATLTLVVQ